MSDARREFVRLALQEGANRRELCRRFGIHPESGYRWLTRWQAGERELVDRSRRPHESPRRSSETFEAEVVALRGAHPAWGARKIAHCLTQAGLPHPRGLDGPCHSDAAWPDPSLRFEKEAPNLLWQMDFKGWARLADGRLCHPLTVIDDHSRFCAGLDACADQQGKTVQDRLTRVFHRHGLPFRNLHEVQAALSDWRDLYNTSAGMRGSTWPSPPIATGRTPGPCRIACLSPSTAKAVLRRVSTTKAYVTFKDRTWRVPRAFCGETLAIRPLERDGLYGLFFAANHVASINLTKPLPVGHVSEQPSVMFPV